VDLASILASPLTLTFRPDFAVAVGVFAAAALMAAWFARPRLFLLVLAGGLAGLAYWYAQPVPFTDPMGQALFVLQRVGATVISALVIVIGSLLLSQRTHAAKALETIE
jgi:hypothetical protein